MNRKEIKKRAKRTVKTHYLFFIVTILIASVIGSKYTEVTDFLSFRSPTGIFKVDKSASVTSFGFSQVYEAVINKNMTAFEEESKEEYEKNENADDKKVGVVSIGYSRGVLAGLANKVHSGSFYVTIYSSILSLTDSESVTQVVFISLGLIFITVFFLFVTSVYEIACARIFLEARTYEKLSFHLFIYPVWCKRWVHLALASFRKFLYETLWMFTIVGGVIKYYSYYLFPYIMAENPDISSKDAIKLSSKMMYGHKWECFVFDLSFILWDIFSFATSGLASLLWVAPYKTAAFAEYYATIREAYKESGGELSELLDDTFLYQKASKALLETAYPKITEDYNEENEAVDYKNPVKKFFADTFGVVLRYDDEEEAVRKYNRKQLRRKDIASILNSEIYPSRLFPIGRKENIREDESYDYIRSYSVTTLVSIFFTMSIFGWLWEVSLTLITEGTLANRGVNYGPWLPIYGTGCLLILLLLNKLRFKPYLEFVASIVLSGFVEYLTSVYLQYSHGQKWWDYSGYFLNINGRVCAEGLLVFGIGGIAVVYVLAPMIDNIARKIKPSVIVPICTALVVCFFADCTVAHFKPNEGKGITDDFSKTQASVSIQSEEISDLVN